MSEKNIPINKTAWVSMLDFVRLVTPILGVFCSILSFIILSFLGDMTAQLKAQSAALADLKTQVAVLSVKFDATTAQIADNKTNIQTYSTLTQQNSSDIKVIYSRLEVANSK